MIVRVVQSAAGEGQEAGRNRRHDRHQEEVHHLAGQARLDLLDRADDGCPHPDRGEQHGGVHRVVERSIVDGQVHNEGEMGDDLDEVEREPGYHGMREPLHPDSGPPSRSHDQPGQPLGDRAQQKRGHDHRVDHVLDHVHRVEVLLGDVVHGPVRRHPYGQDRSDVTDGIAAAVEELTGPDRRGADHPHRVPAQDQGSENEHPDLRMGLEAPEVGVGGEAHPFSLPRPGPDPDIETGEGAGSVVTGP